MIQIKMFCLLRTSEAGLVDNAEWILALGGRGPWASV